jgi:hypothetical protein
MNVLMSVALVLRDFALLYCLLITAVFGGCIYGGYSGDVNWLHLIDIDIKPATASRAAVTATATWTVVTHNTTISAPITSRAYCRYISHSSIHLTGSLFV